MQAAKMTPRLLASLTLATLVATASSPAAADDVPANTPVLALIHIGSETACPRAFLNARNIAQTGQALIQARPGSLGRSALGIMVSQSVGDAAVYLITRHASCGARAVIDAALTMSAVRNATVRP